MPPLLLPRQDPTDDLADSAVTTTTPASPASPTTTSSSRSTAAETTSAKDKEEEEETKTATPASPTTTTSRAVVAADTGTATSTQAAEPTSSGPGAIEQLGNAYDSCEGTADCSQSFVDWASENTWIAAVFGASGLNLVMPVLVFTTVLVPLSIVLAIWLYWHRRRKHKRLLELEEKKASGRSWRKSDG